MKTKLLILLSVLVCIFPSCKKSATTPEATHHQSTSTGLVCDPGTSLGTPVTKEIGPQGGTLQSADGNVRIDVPAGALSHTITISIEPYTNTNPSRLGIAYHITPHGEQFDKPVSITFNYSAFTDSISSPDVLKIAYQDDAGIWNMMNATTLDTVNKTLTYQSTHFSTWTMMPWLILSPFSATLSEDEELTLHAQCYVEDTVLDDLLVPSLAVGYPVGKATPLDGKYIKAWHLIGGGTLIPTTVAEAVYKAPAALPAGNYSSTVTVELQSPNHKLFLLSNISLRSKDFFEMKVGSGAWTRMDAKCVSNGPDKLGIACMGDHFTLSMFWPAGKGTFPWTLEDGSGSSRLGYNYFINDHDNVYMSQYEDASGIHYSGGDMTITEYGNVGEYIAGTFTLSPSGYYRLSDGKQVGTQTIQGRFRLKRAL